MIGHSYLDKTVFTIRASPYIPHFIDEVYDEMAAIAPYLANTIHDDTYSKFLGTLRSMRRNSHRSSNTGSDCSNLRRQRRESMEEYLINLRRCAAQMAMSTVNL